MKKESGIACENGKYKNFTGVIMWGDNEAVVEDASFRLDNSKMGFKYVSFLSGFWINGTFDYGHWYGGTWQNGVWKYGVWYGGTWKNGVWRGGTWGNGVWIGGTWEKGAWEDGVWNGGTWRKGTWIVGEDKNGKLHERNPTTW